MRKAALALGVIALALLAVFLLRVEGGRSDAAAAEPVSEPRARDAPPAEVVPAAGPREETRVIAAEPVAAAAEAEGAPAQESAIAAAETLPLAGTIVVVDEQGVEHRAEDGSFSFVLWTGNSGSWHEVEVRGGNWRTELPRDPTIQSLGVGNVRLGERLAVGGDALEERFPVPADGWIALSARWPSASLLHVRDRESGRELAPVLLTEVHDWPESWLGHPGLAAASARDLGSSPVTLPSSDRPFLGTRMCYTRSPGYAWGRIEIDEQRGGERILLLDPAGELEVAVVGAVSDPGTKLRLFGSESVPVCQLDVPSARAVVARRSAPAAIASRPRSATGGASRWCWPRPRSKSSPAGARA